MIVFVQVSPRRWIAIETVKYENAWYSAHGATTKREAHGLIYQTGERIAGPLGWGDCVRAASAYAEHHCPEKIIPYTQWEQIEHGRQERIKDANRGLGLGAVLTRKAGDDTEP